MILKVIPRTAHGLWTCEVIAAVLLGSGAGAPGVWPCSFVGRDVVPGAPHPGSTGKGRGGGAGGAALAKLSSS